MAHFRDKRVASLLIQEISLILRRDIKDPRVSGFITVTDVEMSKDLKYATVYVSILGDEEHCSKSFEGLLNAAGFIKKKLGETLSLRYIPNLKFKEDFSIRDGSQLYEKLVKIGEEERKLEEQRKLREQQNNESHDSESK